MRAEMTGGVVVRSSEHGGLTLHVLTNGKFAENGYLVEHRASRAALLIDPGHASQRAALELASRGLRIERVLLTHGHFDHVGAAEPLCAAFGVHADAHVADKPLIRQAQLYAMRWEKTLVPVPKRVAYFSGAPRWTWPGGDIETIESPGHTPGSVTYRVGPFAFTGDTVFRRSVGPTFYPGSDRATLLGSVARLLDALPLATLLCAGHGAPWTVAEARDWWREAGHAPETFHIFTERGESANETAEKGPDGYP